MRTEANPILSLESSRQAQAERTRNLPSAARPSSSPAQAPGVPGEGWSPAARPNGPSAPSRDEEAIRKMAADLPTAERESYSDILRILNENAPSVLKAIRAIIAERSGVELPEKPSVDTDLLARTMKLAEAAPDPGRRVTDVAQGVGLAAPPVRNDFLRAASEVLTWEQQAARQAVSQPRPLEAPGTVTIDPATGAYAPGDSGYSVEVNFDLFFSVSARSSVRGGEDASGAFYRATAEVASSFSANLSIAIGGRFLDLADAAEALDPAVLESFSRAVEGLAGLDQDALDRFFGATDELFNALESRYGLGGSALDGVAAEVKAAAGGFFEAVRGATEEAFPGLRLDQIFALPAELDANGSTDLLALLGEVADRDPNSSPRRLLEALTAGENGRALQAPPALPDWTTLLQGVPTAA